ncbi:ATP-binding cassette domain-containing protein [Curvivirga sp.]|uniref:ATP-binding cassette domain-containing protein n=1 Tax=Curvivirga sp. TaxID=2856848 RepID=UPI003B5A1A6C
MDTQPILQEIDLSIYAGEKVAIVGRSGSGKSTLLRGLFGLYAPMKRTNGSIQFQDQMKSSDIAYVPQNPDFGFDPLKRLVWQWKQFCKWHLKAAGKEVEDLQETLTAFGLPALGRKYPHQWSRGMQQRLLIAKAIATHPRLLVLDEPTSALDPIIASVALDHISEYSVKENMALLMVTHDIGLATEFADRIIVLEGGLLAENTPKEQFLKKPASEAGKYLLRFKSWSINQNKAA